MNKKEIKEKKIVNELMNDAFWLGFILEIKRKITNYNQKELLSNFLVFYSSIFCEETIKAKIGGLSGKRNITEKEIEDFRNHNLKYSPNIQSNYSKNILNDMGISLNDYYFDIALTLNKDDLIDINFRNWNLNKKDKFELIDGLVATPIRWIEILMPTEIYKTIISSISNISKTYIDKLDNLCLNKKSYSTYKLFKSSKLDNEEKIYILYRYGLLKNFLYINKIFNEDITYDISNLHFSLKMFLLKCKSILIELFWNDYKSNPQNFILKLLSSENKKLIPDDFYIINRKCRNNLHYSDYHNLSKNDIEVLDEYQIIYLNNILQIFDNNIKFNFGFFYKIGIGFARLEYWSRNINDKNEQ